jgi:hypothetical protein
MTTRIKERKRKAASTSKTPPPSERTAATADKHELYELSVQEPECECDLIQQVWDEQRGRVCRTIREDFCGTAAVCMEWVKRHDDNTAVGVDIDQSVLDWGAARMLDRITPIEAGRVSLICSDVREADVPKVDTVLAMNFSYFLLKDRRQLRDYFKSAYASLVEDGLFLLDAYGGSDAFLELEEPRELDGFTYVWDQNSYNPVNGEATNYIHFQFPDGTELKRAFCYHWRLWTLPEIREILLEAGFQSVAFYWEGTDDDTGEGNGEWFCTEKGDADHGWVAYIAGIK